MTTSEQIKVWRQEVPCPSSCTLCQPESRSSTSPSDGGSTSEEAPKPNNTTAANATANASKGDEHQQQPQGQHGRPSSPTRRVSWALKSFLSSKSHHIHMPILHADPERAEKKKFQKFCKKGGEEPVEKLDPTRMYEEMLGAMGEDLEGPVSDSWAGEAGDALMAGNLGREMKNQERLRRAKLRYELDKMAWKQKQPEELIGRVCT